MFLFVFARAKRRSGEIAKFQFLIHPASKKSKKVLVTMMFFLYLFCYSKPGLWIKTKFGSPAIPWTEPLTTKKGGITKELYGKILSSLYPTL